MDGLFAEFADAYEKQNGYLLASTLTPVNPRGQPDRLKSIRASTNAHSVGDDIHRLIKRNARGIGRKEMSGWIEVYTGYWTAVGDINAGEDGKSTWTRVYEVWRDLAVVLIRAYTTQDFEAWTVPCLYMVGKYLRLFAIKSDEELHRESNEPSAGSLIDEPNPEADDQKQLRDCEQVLKRMFSCCLMDRAPLEQSRKWGLYFIVNLLFKTYFQLNSAPLSRSILKTMESYKKDLPPLAMFPKSQQCTFKYYEGVLFFLEENYPEAEKHLTEAWNMCHSKALAQNERILTYLVPCRLLTSHALPTKALLNPFPGLQKLFLPLAECIKQGNLKAFDEALLSGEDKFVKRRIYLTLERGRDVALRNLLRKVFIAGGFEEPGEGESTPVRRTRIPLAEFQVAISMGSEGVLHDPDEVECLVANMIYKNLMKGYIARERGVVVLSKKGAFPGTGI